MIQVCGGNQMLASSLVGLRRLSHQVYTLYDRQHRPSNVASSNDARQVLSDVSKNNRVASKSIGRFASVCVVNRLNVRVYIIVRVSRSSITKA